MSIEQERLIRDLRGVKLSKAVREFVMECDSLIKKGMNLHVTDQARLYELASKHKEQIDEVNRMRERASITISVDGKLTDLKDKQSLYAMQRRLAEKKNAEKLAQTAQADAERLKSTSKYGF